jgi:hypothetical protein
MPLKFVIPLATEAASAFRKLVEEHGGPEHFFEQMTDSGVKIIAELMQNNRRASQVLYEATANEVYQREVIESINDDADREFVEVFFAGWRKWKLFNPTPWETLKIFLTGSLKESLLGPVPRQVNDVWDCDAMVYLDTFGEDLYVKSVMKLYRPNKELGGSYGWITSSSVKSYLSTISMMLNALSLRESEMELIRIPPSRAAIIDDILHSAESVSKSLETVRQQFEKMKST